METIHFIKTTKTADERSAYAIVDHLFLFNDWGYTIDKKLIIDEQRRLHTVPIRRLHKFNEDTWNYVKIESIGMIFLSNGGMTLKLPMLNKKIHYSYVQ